jgi:hypothetical protein
VSARAIPGTNAIWVEKAVGPTGAPYDIIRVPNTLAAKAGEFRAASAPIDEIDAIVASLQDEYPDRAAPDVARALALWRRICESTNGDEAARQELARLAHDFKGTGKTYGYPLVSFIGGSLYGLLNAPVLARPLGRAAVDAHVAALAEVLRAKLFGDGGPAGEALAAGLAAAAAKAQAPTPAAAAD